MRTRTNNPRPSRADAALISIVVGVAVACAPPDPLASPEAARFTGNGAMIALGVVEDEVDPAVTQGWVAFYEDEEQPEWQVAFDGVGPVRLRDAVRLREMTGEIVVVGSSGEAALVMLLDSVTGSAIWEREISLAGATLVAHSVTQTATIDDIVVAGSISDPSPGMFVLRMSRDGSVWSQQHFQHSTELVPSRVVPRPVAGWFLGAYESGLEIGQSFVMAFLDAGAIEWAKRVPAAAPTQLTDLVAAPTGGVIAAGIGPGLESADPWAAHFDVAGAKQWMYFLDAPLGNESRAFVDGSGDRFVLVSATDAYGRGTPEATDLLLTSFGADGLSNTVSYGGVLNDVPLAVRGTDLAVHVDENVLRWQLSSGVPEGCGREIDETLRLLIVSELETEAAFSDVELGADVREVTNTLVQRGAVPLFVCVE